MAISGSVLIVGGAIVFGLPLAVVLLNKRKRNAGWWMLLVAVFLVIAGNAIEIATA